MRIVLYLFDRLLVGTFAFWVLETLFFILRDGWHIKAVTADEIACDKIVSIGISLSCGLFIAAIYSFLNLWRNTDSINGKND
jgi:hypothetical protein